MERIELKPVQLARINSEGRNGRRGEKPWLVHGRRGCSTFSNIFASRYRTQR